MFRFSLHLWQDLQCFLQVNNAINCFKNAEKVKYNDKTISLKIYVILTLLKNSRSVVFEATTSSDFLVTYISNHLSDRFNQGLNLWVEAWRMRLCENWDNESYSSSTTDTNEAQFPLWHPVINSLIISPQIIALIKISYPPHNAEFHKCSRLLLEKIW